MYPDRELTQLAAHKEALQRDIARRRAQCLVAAARLARPFAWMDRMLAFWRRLSPLTQAAVPLGFMIQRTVFPRFKILGTLARWGPVVFAAARGLCSAAKRRTAPNPSANGRH